jgi:uncharacterized protein (TIGR03067 family)
MTKRYGTSHAVILGILVFVFSAVSIGSADDSDEGKKAADSLQGEWILTTVKFADYELHCTDRKPIKITFDKERMITNPNVFMTTSTTTQFFPYKSESTVGISVTDKPETATFVIVDSAKTPAQIDLRVTIKKDDVRFRKSIFQLKDDELTMCVGTFLHRPSEFKADGLETVWVMKRVPKK